MYFEYPHTQNKDLLKQKIDKYVSKLNKLEFYGNFKITTFSRSWNNYEMLYSLTVKQGFLERKLQGLLQVKDELIIVEFEIPDIVKNFVREEKLEFLIAKHLDNVIEEVSLLQARQAV